MTVVLVSILFVDAHLEAAVKEQQQQDPNSIHCWEDARMYSVWLTQVIQPAAVFIHSDKTNKASKLKEAYAAVKSSFSSES